MSARFEVAPKGEAMIFDGVTATNTFHAFEQII